MTLPPLTEAQIDAICDRYEQSIETYYDQQASKSPSFSDLVRDPSEIRSTAATLGDELGHENTYLELLRFLPTAVTAEFIDHLREVADIEDLL